MEMGKHSYPNSGLEEINTKTNKINKKILSSFFHDTKKVKIAITLVVSNSPNIYLCYVLLISLPVFQLGLIRLLISHLLLKVHLYTAGVALFVDRDGQPRVNWWDPSERDKFTLSVSPAAFDEKRFPRILHDFFSIHSKGHILHSDFDQCNDAKPTAGSYPDSIHRIQCSNTSSTIHQDDVSYGP